MFCKGDSQAHFLYTLFGYVRYLEGKLAFMQTEEPVDKQTVHTTENDTAQTGEPVVEPVVEMPVDVLPQVEETVKPTHVEVVPEEATPETQSWRDVVHPWWKALLTILPIFLLTRLLFVLLTYLGGVLFTAADFAATSVSYHDLLANLNRGDVSNYITIATSGYTQPQQTLLFPLFPALVRALAPLFRQSQLTAGFFLANLAFLGVLTVFYRLVESETDRETAKRAVLYLAIFPTAFVFFLAYSESLFLLLTLLSFYSMRRGLWWFAGLFGALATLTQFAGVFLCVVFLWEYIRQMGPQIRRAWKESAFFERVRPLLPACAVVLIPLALALYFFALGTFFGSPLVFLRTQAQNGAGAASFLLALKALVAQPHLGVGSAHALLDLTALLLFALLLLLCFVGPERLEKSQWSFGVFGVLLLLSALLFSGNGGQDSLLYEPLALMPRLVVGIFPGFILLARLGRRAEIGLSYLLLALPMLAFLLLQFLTGRWLI